MKRIVALLLCFALILPLAPIAMAEKLEFYPSSYITDKTEVLSKRSAYSKTYVLPNGSYLYTAYSEPVHYEDSAGAYIEINNEITTAVKQAGYKFTNTANAWQAHFSEKLNDNDAVMLTSGKYNIAFSFAGQTDSAITAAKATEPSGSKQRSTLSAYHQKLSQDNRVVIYSDVAENVDIAYTVKTEALKEDIILKSRTAPSVYKFRLTANGLTLKENGDTLALFTPTGKEEFTFAPLYMEDANGKRSEEVTLTYTSVKNGYELTVSADPAFLNAADTVYPVVIDPSVMVTGSSVTYDTCVDQQYPSSNYYLSESLWTGGAYGTNAMRTYIKFDLPSDIYASQVNSAYISLLKKDYQDPTIRAYRVTGSWSSSSVTWNNKPGYDSSDYSSTAQNSTGGWYYLDVTGLVQNWLGGFYTNNGLVLMEPGELVSEQKTKFYSSDAPSPNKPELVINYSPYYGSRSYEFSDAANINCLGYAIQHSGNISSDSLGINEVNANNWSMEKVNSFFKDKLRIWLINNLNTGTSVSNWEYIDASDSLIHENWFRVAIRLTVNGAGDIGYHAFYQTSDGRWAEKPGPNTLPSTVGVNTPETGDHMIFLQIREGWDANWP